MDGYTRWDPQTRSYVSVPSARPPEVRWQEPSITVVGQSWMKDPSLVGGLVLVAKSIIELTAEIKALRVDLAYLPGRGEEFQKAKEDFEKNASSSV